MNERKQTGFYQYLVNEAKMGAYYTDVDHAYRIGRHFQIKTGPVFVLEPSIGDGRAVEAFVRGIDGGDSVQIYGVEYDPLVAAETKKRIPYTICADFLDGVAIANRTFSLAFVNPPYGTNGMGVRLETLFIEKLYKYLMANAFAVLILPRVILTDPKFQESFTKRYQLLKTYRFDESEYEKYRQFALIAKAKNNMYKIPDHNAMLEWPNIENCEGLPGTEAMIDCKFVVEPARKQMVLPFTSSKFVPEMVHESIKGSSLFHRFNNISQAVEYMPIEYNNPPTELSSSMLCMAAVSGVGAGLAGNEDDGTLHLQKGVVKMEEKDEAAYSQDGKITKVINTTYQKTSFNILDNNGNFKSLE